jgi:hypothetical protein
MGRFVGRMIELGMLYAATRTHPLQITRDDRRAVPHRVAMRQLTGQDPAENFHVPMAMGAEARSGGDSVFINDPQRAESHVIRIVITGERKAMPGI